MKKFIIAASLLATTIISANAQDETMAGAGYKPVKGDVTAEVGIQPTSGLLPNVGLSNTSGSSTSLLSGAPSGVLRFRYFFADQMAIRVGLNLYKSTTKNDFPNSSTSPAPSPAPTIISGTQKSSMSQTLINLGVEKHFSGTERLSTYAGADLLILMSGSKQSGTGVSAPVSNPSNGTAGASYDYKNTLGGQTAFGLRAVVGADYYIVKKVYLGIELGWGFLVGKDKDVEKKTNPGSGGTASTTTSTGGKSFNLVPSAVTALRLGFRF